MSANKTNLPAHRESDDDDDANAVEPGRKYRAPALEKGLDIIELLATAPTGLTLAAIVQALGRSSGELFRMVQVLEYRGFIDQPERDGAYTLTDKLFSLGLEQPRNKTMIESALPIMRELALQLGQSCHLVFHSRGEIVVVARMESSDQIGLSVRIGYRRPLPETASGAILYAFQTPEVQALWRKLFKPALTAAALNKFHQICDQARRNGNHRQPSSFVDGVTDLSAPILRGQHAAAALTVPFLRTKQGGVSLDEAAERLSAAAGTISALLVQNDHRI